MVRIIALAAILWTAAAHAVPETVHFMSRDGTTRLVGYLFLPDTPGPHPAVVMLHGRAGSYSILKPGIHTAESLTMRHRMWGEFWAKRGYVALHVDSFGPRGHPDGFPKHSYQARPAEVSERSVRPLDAYGALDYLRTRSDVSPGRIGVQGWSNGGMTVLAAVGPKPPGLPQADVEHGFRAAIAEYPGCAIPAKEDDYKPYLPLIVFSGTDDDEVSPWTCQRFAQSVQQRGGTLEFVLYQGANHAYDDPGKTKQSRMPNHDAMIDTLERAARFFDRHLQ